MNDETKIDDETKLLAAMAYGESSNDDVADEMNAIASVLVRQRNARGYTSISTFAKSDKTFSFVVKDGNVRYQKLMKSNFTQIKKDPGMCAAVEAAKNALLGGPDLSNGAYFWDGYDIKTNYKNHFKVRHGIKFSDPAHNIYNIVESTNLVILKKNIIKKLNGKTVNLEAIEIGRYDHTYESTAALGGTIFWRYSDEYLRVTKAKAYK